MPEAPPAEGCVSLSWVSRTQIGPSHVVIPWPWHSHNRPHEYPKDSTRFFLLCVGYEVENGECFHRANHLSISSYVAGFFSALGAKWSLPGWAKCSEILRGSME